MNAPQVGQIGQYGVPDGAEGVAPLAALVLAVQESALTIAVISPYPTDQPVGLSIHVGVPVAESLTLSAWAPLPAAPLPAWLTSDPAPGA